jgi:hypothetical protein
MEPRMRKWPEIIIPINTLKCIQCIHNRFADEILGLASRHPAAGCTL